MKNHVLFGFLTLLVLANGWMIAIADLPFSQIDIALAVLSILVMTVLGKRFTFLYVALIILGYGGFLTGFSFLFHQTGTIQRAYIYDHLLVTSFLLLYWILIYQLKAVSDENMELKLQVAKLEKLDKDTQILTPDEFMYQARWILASTKRHGQAWLIVMVVDKRALYAQGALQEYLETAVLESIRVQYDIVTAVRNKIFFILKDTDEAGVSIVLERIRNKQKEQFNLITPPYDLHHELFEDESQLGRMEEVLI